MLTVLAAPLVALAGCASHRSHDVVAEVMCQAFVDAICQTLLCIAAAN